MKNIVLAIICFLLSVAAASAEGIGTVKKFSGNIELYDGTSPRPAIITDPNTPFDIKNRLASKRTSSALLQLNSGDRIALSENSTITFSEGGKYTPEGGKVVFSIKKRGTETGIVKIGLKTAVIGVKGTEFLIDIAEDGKCKVYLKDGEISVDSVEGEFRKHSKVVMDEYEAYVKKMMGEYDKYVSDLQKKYTEYVTTFSMTSGQAISIEGQDVNTVDFDDKVIKEFELLDM